MTHVKRFFQRLLKYAISFFLMIYSLSFGLVTRKGQYLHTIICEYYGFTFLKPKLPVISWNEVLPNQPVKLIDITVRPGSMFIHELAVLNSLILAEKPETIFEIGTMNGRTTLNMALNSPEPCKIYTLDLPREALGHTRYQISKRYRALVDKNSSGALFALKDETEFPEKKKITQLYGDSAQFDFSPYLNTIDFVFIDGSHDYDYVLNDSEIALKLLKEGHGVIIWHDHRSGIEVVKAIRTLEKRHSHLNIYQIKDTSFAYLKM